MDGRPVPVPAQPIAPADHTDAFEVAADGDRRSAEAWSRAVFEDAPRPVRWFLLAGWRGVLGFRLGPRPDPGHVLGWRITATRPDTVHLELRSPLMTGRLALSTGAGRLALTTTVRYRRRPARALWALVGPVHRRMVPYLLRRAAALHRPAA